MCIIFYYMVCSATTKFLSEGLRYFVLQSVYPFTSRGHSGASHKGKKKADLSRYQIYKLVSF